MELIHQESSPVELGGLASDGYECVGKFFGKDGNYVVWHHIDRSPRWILDEEYPLGGKTEYRRLEAGNTTQLILEAMKIIDKPFRH